ncbi:MAG: FmdE family protein [Mailhella sp.]|nr:FmdE family protein [Mailhella sp.]
MKRLVPRELSNRASLFHDHRCIELNVGIRAAAWALENMGGRDARVIATAEASSCAVDALQAILGCTAGRGNLIVKNDGRLAFSFYRLSDGMNMRLSYIPGSAADLARILEIKEHLGAGNLSEWIRTRLEIELSNLQKKEIHRLMSAPLEEVFRISPLTEPPVPVRRGTDIFVCERCGESFLEKAADMKGAPAVLCRICRGELQGEE